MNHIARAETPERKTQASSRSVRISPRSRGLRRPAAGARPNAKREEGGSCKAHCTHQRGGPAETEGREGGRLHTSLHISKHQDAKHQPLLQHPQTSNSPTVLFHDLVQMKRLDLLCHRISSLSWCFRVCSKVRISPEGSRARVARGAAIFDHEVSHILNSGAWKPHRKAPRLLEASVERAKTTGGKRA